VGGEAQAPTLTFSAVASACSVTTGSSSGPYGSGGLLFNCFATDHVNVHCPLPARCFHYDRLGHRFEDCDRPWVRSAARRARGAPGLVPVVWSRAGPSGGRGLCRHNSCAVLLRGGGRSPASLPTVPVVRRRRARCALRSPSLG
jgi:hypothetical protein